jgi:peptidoglycan pentaglycine glycine transferase (the first glycine)
MANEREWDSFFAQHPDAHLLQSGQWGKLKSAFGWQPDYAVYGGVGAQVLFRPVLAGFRFAYLPRGPVPSSPESLTGILPALDQLCRAHKAIFLKIEPDFGDSPDSVRALQAAGFVPSIQTVQPPRTILVDLQGTDDDLLGRMKQKTRYNIRLAMKHGVAVEASEDTGIFSRMMEVTGERDSFSIHAGDYYRNAYSLFSSTQNVCLLLAKYQDRPVAGLMAFAQGRRAWYLYGASTDEHRDVMAPYLLQWEAMRWARARGCTEYDLWGIPDEEEAALEAQFAARQDGLWGVYRFKRGFGGKIWRSVGAWDKPYHRPMYALYQMWMRRRHRVQQ